jgi:phage gp36-like protein
MPPITVYASLTDLADLSIGKLAQIQNPQKTRALAKASAWVDSYIRNRYTLPLMVVDESIRRVTLAIAVYDLLAHKLNPENDGDKEIRKRYDDAIAWLESVQAGSTTPAVVDSVGGGAADAGASSSAATSGRARVTSSSSRGFSNRGTGQPRGLFGGD